VLVPSRPDAAAGSLLHDVKVRIAPAHSAS
jgi:hypothetical protein